MAWLNAWSPFFKGSVRMQGRALYDQKSVTRQAPQEDEVARFAAHDNNNEHEIIVRSDDNGLTIQCDCPHFQSGAYCAHTWATLINVSKHPSGVDGKFDEVGEISPRPPRARKRAGTAIVRKRVEPEWMTRLSQLRGQAYTDDQTIDQFLPIQREVCYVIKPSLCVNQHAIAIELMQRQPTVQGWSKPKTFKINSASVSQLTDPQDRELCALLLGGAWIHEDAIGNISSSLLRSRRALIRLPEGSWQSMLQRMIETERCFLESGDQLLELQWNNPPLPRNMDEGTNVWSLWLLGNEENENLELSLELRRLGQTMAIHEPSVILGGHDGIVIYGNQVSPFNDHGAYQWVSHFREDIGHTDRAKPICVSMKETDRFLDRLYAMSQLPEVDLPEHLGHQEQWIRPTPIMEIFSSRSGSDENGRQSRKQLSAQTKFDYGGQIVAPHELGRFVTIPIEAQVADGESKTEQNIDQNTEQNDTKTKEAAPTQTNEDQALANQADSPKDEDAITEMQPDTQVSADKSEEAKATSEAQKESDRETSPTLLIRRDRELEANAMRWVLSLGFRQTANLGDTMTLPAKQLNHAVNALLSRGWRVTADQRVLRQPGPPRLSVASGVDWFEVRGSVKFETENGSYEVTLPELLTAVRSGEQMITLGDGTQGLLPQDWLEQHGLLTKIGQLQDDHLRFKSSQVALLDALLQRQELISLDEKFQEARERLKRFDGIKPLPVGPHFQGTLRPYQSEALGWFGFLRWFGMGGILADDMGLGKTVQVLAMLDMQKHSQQSQEQGQPNEKPLPSIIVAPRSVVFNWIDETKRFAPQLKVLAYGGTNREELRNEFNQYDIIITSYGLMRRDIAELREHPFNYVVLDEAQSIKNPSSQSAKAARVINARHRLALTGTPVENHLGDLWSIFEFLNPGMLGSSSRFGKLIRGESGTNKATMEPETVSATSNQISIQQNKALQDIESKRGNQIAEQVAAGLRPFILRRTKDQVLTDLPAKTEQTILCEMGTSQRRLYNELRDHYRGALLKGDSSDMHGAKGSSIMVLEALLRLRQVACHPGLVDKKYANDPSAKLEALIDSLVELSQEGHKALVFSQFVEMLNLVRKRLDELGITYEYLDGQTRDRKRRVNRFQADPDCPVFLISLKAGGLGLNLTAAEYVFILDPWWNPAVEQQAIDRTHRIGQTRHVFAYRMICQDTVEQRIAQLQNKKRQLADAIVGGQNSVLQNLSREDLEQLLS